MDEDLTVDVAVFEERAGRLLDDVASGRVRRITVLAEDRPVAVLSSAETPESAVKRVHGFLRGRTQALVETDLTHPIFDGELAKDPLLSRPDAA
jgi:hypothetical protein